MAGKQRGTRRQPRDAKKEASFRELVEILADAGYAVRREELRRGPGWRAVSGACRCEKDAIIFVDRRLSQDDQVEFLVMRIKELGLSVSIKPDSVLPQTLQRVLTAVAV